MNKSLLRYSFSRVSLLVLLFFSNCVNASDCLNWFLTSGLASKQPGCSVQCFVTPVDMKTFYCPEKCDQLCSKTTAEHVLAYVPRLTEGDRVVVSKMPYKAYRVFLSKEKVDKITAKIFKTPGRKDESDAFRHFVWSSLIVSDLGVAAAQVFLNAHEEDSTQSSDEKKMDLFNNKQGIDFISTRTKAGLQTDLAEIEKEALRRLRENKLMVLQRKLKEIPGGYYSK